MVKPVLALSLLLSIAPIAGSALGQVPAGRPRGGQPESAANCTNPSITFFLHQLGKGTAADVGTQGLCNPGRYHEGNWRSDDELKKFIQQSFICDIPWLGQIYGEPELGGSAPNGRGSIGECNPGLYEPGHWFTYADLKREVQKHRGMPTSAPGTPAPDPRNAHRPPLAGGANPGSSQHPSTPPPPVSTAPPPAMPPQPEPVFLGPVTLPPEFTQATTQAAGAVRADNAGVDGLADAVSKLGSDSPIDPVQAAQQVAFLQGYDALVEMLSNPAELASAGPGEPPAVDPEVLARLIEQTRILEQHRAIHALYQEAGLATPGAFYLTVILGDDTCPLPKPTLGVRTDWSAYSRIEIIVQELRIASHFKAAAGVTGAVSSALDKLESAIDDQNLDKLPVPQVQAALKAEAVASAIVTIADSMAKAGVAFMPNQISRFYTTINGQPRNPNDPPISIMVGDRARVAAYMETSSPGGSIMTPYQAAKLVADRVLKLKKVEAWLNKLPAEKKANWDLAMELNKELTKRIQNAWSKVANFPVIKGWADSVAQLWTIKAFKNPPAEINSDAVLNMGSRSPALIKVGIANLPMREHQYYIEGLAVGQQAGYHVGLKSQLITELGPSSPIELTRNAVVNVVDKNPSHTGTPADWGKPCNSMTGAIGSGSGTWMPAPSNKWIPDGKGGAKPDPAGPWICGEAQ